MGFQNPFHSQPESYGKKKHYKFSRTLGAGTYGVVREAEHDKYGKVAVKIIEKKTVKGHEDMVYDEIHMLQGLDHPHIIHFKEWFESTTKFYVTTTLATGGELFDRICAMGRFTEQDAVVLIQQVLGAINYLHERGIVHRDLKPENLLYLTPAKDSQLVLADFGIAKQVNEKETLRSMAGSYGYAAPEILRRIGHSFPADLWSLGVITYTILCGYSPFRAEDRDDLIAETCRADVIFHERYWNTVSQEAKDFILDLLNPDPTKRLTAKQALADVWITGKTATESDLLPAVKAGFNARKKFKRAVELVRLSNRLRALEVSDTEEEPSDVQAKTHSRQVSSDFLAVPLDPVSRPSSAGSNHSGSGAGRKFRSNSMVFAEVVKAKVREAELEREDDRNHADAETIRKHVA